MSKIITPGTRAQAPGLPDPAEIHKPKTPGLFRTPASRFTVIASLAALSLGFMGAQPARAEEAPAKPPAKKPTEALVATARTIGDLGGGAGKVGGALTDIGLGKAGKPPERVEVPPKPPAPVEGGPDPNAEPIPAAPDAPAGPIPEPPAVVAEPPAVVAEPDEAPTLDPVDPLAPFQAGPGKPGLVNNKMYKKYPLWRGIRHEHNVERFHATVISLNGTPVGVDGFTINPDKTVTLIDNVLWQRGDKYTIVPCRTTLRGVTVKEVPFSEALEPLTERRAFKGQPLTEDVRAANANLHGFLAGPKAEVVSFGK